MKKIYSLILMAGVLFSASSCSHEDVEQTLTQEGAITLKVGVKDELSVRATTNEILNDAVIKIYKPLYEGLVREYTYSTLPTQIFLPATTGSDKYRVDVTAGERVKANPIIASFDRKSYKGSAEFAVSAGTITSEVAVTAKICNALTQPTFKASIGEAFGTDYSLTIALGDNKLVYDATKSGVDGFFIISDTAFEPELKWTFTGKSVKDGSAFTKSGKFVVAQGTRYKMAFNYTEKDGTLNLTVTVDKSVTEYDDEIVFEPTSTGISSTKKHEIWATHTTLHADVDTSMYDETKVYFEYRLNSDSGEWVRMADPAKEDDKNEGVFSAVLSGLTPSTSYEYRLVVSGKENGTEEIVEGTKSFTTDVAPNIPNGSFEDTAKIDADYVEFWNPASAIVENRTAWWGNGNAGSSMGGKIISLPDTTEKVDGNQSACLASANAVIKFAAGNLFSGSFAGTVGTKGGKVNFGRPFIGRPTKLRFWAKYSTGKVTHVGDGGTLTTKDYDSGRVQIALGTWTASKYGGIAESPVLVNTTITSTFIDYNTDPSTIAYGEHMFVGNAENSENVWQEITIDLKYADLTTWPTHIIISGAASYQGDYFTGCETSKLWLDKMELIYDEDVTVK